MTKVASGALDAQKRNLLLMFTRELFRPPPDAAAEMRVQYANRSGQIEAAVNKAFQPVPQVKTAVATPTTVSIEKSPKPAIDTPSLTELPTKHYALFSSVLKACGKNDFCSAPAVVHLLSQRQPGLLSGAGRLGLKKLLATAQQEGLPVKWRDKGKGMLQLTGAWYGAKNSTKVSWLSQLAHKNSTSASHQETTIPNAGPQDQSLSSAQPPKTQVLEVPSGPSPPHENLTHVLLKLCDALLSGAGRLGLKKLLVTAQQEGLPVKWRDKGKGMLRLMAGTWSGAKNSTKVSWLSRLAHKISTSARHQETTIPNAAPQDQSLSSAQPPKTQVLEVPSGPSPPHDNLMHVLLKLCDAEGRIDASKAASALRLNAPESPSLQSRLDHVKQMVIQAQLEGFPLYWIQSESPAVGEIQLTLSPAMRENLRQSASSESTQASKVVSSASISENHSKDDTTAVHQATSTPHPSVPESQLNSRYGNLVKILLLRCDEKGVSRAKTVAKTVLKKHGLTSGKEGPVAALKNLVLKAQITRVPVIWIDGDRPTVQLTLDAAARKSLRAHVLALHPSWKSIAATTASKPTPTASQVAKADKAKSLEETEPHEIATSATAVLEEVGQRSKATRSSLAKKELSSTPPVVKAVRVQVAKADKAKSLEETEPHEIATSATAVLEEVGQRSKATRSSLAKKELSSTPPVVKARSRTVFSSYGGHYIRTSETSVEALLQHELAASQPGTLMFYTDGSHYVSGHLGAGVYCPELQLRASFIMDVAAGSSLDAEIYAIVEAVKAATARPRGSFQAVVICSDAQNAVSASQDKHPPKTQRFVLALRRAVAEFNKHHSVPLTLQWLKKNSFEANTLADQLARIGSC